MNTTDLHALVRAARLALGELTDPDRSYAVEWIGTPERCPSRDSDWIEAFLGAFPLDADGQRVRGADFAVAPVRVEIPPGLQDGPGVWFFCAELDDALKAILAEQLA